MREVGVCLPHQICLSIAEADDGGLSVVPHGGGEAVSCFALDSPSMFLPEVGRCPEPWQLHTHVIPEVATA